MYFKVVVGFLLFLGSQNPKADHAIYLSTIEINSNQVSIKVFTDDLQDALKNYGDSISKSIDDSQLINSYFSDRLNMIINQKPKQIELIKSKVEGDATFLYFSFEDVSDWSSLRLKADYFMELFPDQSNVMTVINGSKKYYARLTKSNPSYLLNFD